MTVLPGETMDRTDIMYTYKVVIKEVGNDYTMHRTITTNGDLEYVKNHFGLEDADIEWYTIEKGKEEDNE